MNCIVLFKYVNEFLFYFTSPGIHCHYFFYSTAAVAYLECDVGQTEFSPPATVSLHIITQPVLGLLFLPIKY